MNSSCWNAWICLKDFAIYQDGTLKRFFLDYRDCPVVFLICCFSQPFISRKTLRCILPFEVLDCILTIAFEQWRWSALYRLVYLRSYKLTMIFRIVVSKVCLLPIFYPISGRLWFFCLCMFVCFYISLYSLDGFWHGVPLNWSCLIMEVT